MKSLDELMDKAEELVSKEGSTAADREAAAILVAFAGYDEEDGVTDPEFKEMLENYKKDAAPVKQEAVEIVKSFLF